MQYLSMRWATARRQADIANEIHAAMVEIWGVGNHMKRKTTALAKGRTMVLVDIENLIGKGRFGIADAVAVREMLWRDVDLPDDAQFTVATSAEQTLINAALGWPGSRVLYRLGADGADLCLAAVAMEERLAQRYSHVVIASGDGIFTGTAQMLRDQGAVVTVAGRAGSVAWSLRAAADVYVELCSFRTDITREGITLAA